MLIYNCTKAAYDFFFAKSIKEDKSILEDAKPSLLLAEEPVLHDVKSWHWLVHVSKVNRKNVILAMDTDSRFCLMFAEIKKGDVAAFTSKFLNRLARHNVYQTRLARLNNDYVNFYTKRFQKHHLNYEFVIRGDRSVQAHINEIFNDIKYGPFDWHDLPVDDALFEFDLHHNDCLRKRKHDKDYIYPSYVFFENWLNVYSPLVQAEKVRALKEFEANRRLMYQERIAARHAALGFDAFVQDEDDVFEVKAQPGKLDNVVSFMDYAKRK